jgi:hypothetical protein
MYVALKQLFTLVVPVAKVVLEIKVTPETPTATQAEPS